MSPSIGRHRVRSRACVRGRVYEDRVTPGRERPFLRVVTQRWAREHVLTAEDVAVVFDASPDRVAAWVQRGQLSGIPQPGGARRFHPSEVLALLEAVLARSAEAGAGPRVDDSGSPRCVTSDNASLTPAVDSVIVPTQFVPPTAAGRRAEQRDHNHQDPARREQAEVHES